MGLWSNITADSIVKTPSNALQNTITGGAFAALTIIAMLGAPALLVENTENERLFEVSGGGHILVGTGATPSGTSGQCLQSGGGSGEIMAWGACGGGGGGSAGTGNALSLAAYDGTQTLSGSNITITSDLDGMSAAGTLTGGQLAATSVTSCTTALETNDDGRIVCGTDPSDSDTTYTAGEGLSLSSTSFSRNAVMTGTSLSVTGNLTGATLDISGTMSGNTLVIGSLKSCNTIDTDADGNLSCGTDEGHSNGANCAAGEIPLGVDANGAVEGCYEPSVADLSDVNAGTDLTADLEEEAHCSEHDSADVDCSGETIVFATDSVDAVNLAEADFGDWTVSADTATLDTDSVSDNEIDYTTVTLADFTDDVGYEEETHATEHDATGADPLSTFSGSSMTGEVMFVAGTRSCTTALETGADGKIVCGTDPTDNDTTYTAGEGLSLAGTVFSRVDTITGASLNVTGNVTGSQVFITGVTSCTEALETNADGKIVCGTDETGGGGGSSYTGSGSANRVTLWLDTEHLTSDAFFTFNTGSTLVEVEGTISGATIRAQNALASSGTLAVTGNADIAGTAALQGVTVALTLSVTGRATFSDDISVAQTISGARLYVATAMSGAGLTDCNTNNRDRVQWDATNEVFSCDTDTFGTADVAGLDVSDDLNLTCGTNCTLTGDEISVDDAFVINSGSDTMAGTLTADGLTMDANENITLGGQTIDHDGTDFVFSDSILVTSVEATGTLSGESLIVGGSSTGQIMVAQGGSAVVHKTPIATFEWRIAGGVAAGSGGSIISPVSCTNLPDITMVVDENPVDNALQIDIDDDGVSIFSTLPEIDAGAGSEGREDDNHVFGTTDGIEVGDRIDLQIVQNGGNGGTSTGLTVMLHCVPAL